MPIERVLAEQSLSREVLDTKGEAHSDSHWTARRRKHLTKLFDDSVSMARGILAAMAKKPATSERRKLRKKLG